MDMTFSSAALAALCNSERRLTQRWGPEIGRAVARRLLDLAATDAAALDRLPGARIITNGTGETTVTFGEMIVIRGVISNSTNGTRAPQSDADHMVITSLDVQGSDQR
jgi:hypothetical protein